MKYIKTYEGITKNIYKKGDIVLIQKSISAFLLPYAKIKRRDCLVPRSQHQYYVEILFPDTTHWTYSSTDEEHTTFIEDYLIIRKLTKPEIEELKIKLNADKYNL